MLLSRCVFVSLILMWAAVDVYAYDYENNENDLTEPTTMYCFQCTSKLDTDCVNIQPNNTDNYHYKPCMDTESYQGKQPFCRKIVQRIYEIDNLEITIRKCGWITHPRLDCYSVKNDDHEETICQCFTPGCNGSSSLQPSVAALLALLVAFWTVRWK